jgi:hypothetical protein
MVDELDDPKNICVNPSDLKSFFGYDLTSYPLACAHIKLKTVGNFLIQIIKYSRIAEFFYFYRKKIHQPFYGWLIL